MKSIKGLAYKFVIFFMRANPNPFNAIADFVSQRSIMISNANGKTFGASAKFFEVKRRVTRIVVPESVIFYGQTLNGFRQLLVEFPKPARDFGSHSLSEGQS
ncbi:MAG TPA: hypothetical protein VE344_01335 [Methylomirabilota bacterium]|nr:hypothetical protein [Methylomirabilota bacterium]